jgi:hypothetical protein
MLRSLLTGACLATLLAGCTTAPATRADTKEAATTAGAQRTTCLTETGTRLGLRPGECAGFGRSFSNEDIDRTGRVGDVGAALQMLDPSITTHH